MPPKRRRSLPGEGTLKLSTLTAVGSLYAISMFLWPSGLHPVRPSVFAIDSNGSQAPMAASTRALNLNPPHHTNSDVFHTRRFPRPRFRVYVTETTGWQVLVPSVEVLQKAIAHSRSSGCQQASMLNTVVRSFAHLCDGVFDGGTLLRDGKLLYERYVGTNGNSVACHEGN